MSCCAQATSRGISVGSALRCMRTHAAAVMMGAAVIELAAAKVEVVLDEAAVEETGAERAFWVELCSSSIR